MRYLFIEIKKIKTGSDWNEPPNFLVVFGPVAFDSWAERFTNGVEANPTELAKAEHLLVESACWTFETSYSFVPASDSEWRTGGCFRLVYEFDGCLYVTVWLRQSQVVAATSSRDSLAFICCDAQRAKTVAAANRFFRARGADVAEWRDIWTQYVPW